MKRGALFVVLFLILLFPIISSTSIDSEIQKVTHYAEEYEIGNINYVQLLIYTSSARERLNEEFGAFEKESGGILKQQQIESILGEPNEKTKWMWAEGLDHDVKIDEYVPVWRKIIFDGKKIQIRLNAYPSVFVKEYFNKEFKTEEEAEIFEEEKLKELNNGEFTADDVIYRLHFEIDFKRSEQEINIKERISEVESLAEQFNSNPSDSNAELLAKASVDTEKIFQNYFEQTNEDCNQLMSSIFGSENKRETQNLIVQEIDLHEGDNFQATARLEMCDDCEWNWINLDVWIDSRGKFKLPDEEFSEYNQEKYKNMDDETLQLETYNLIEEIKSSLDVKDFQIAMNSANELRALTNAWNEKANDVWEEVDKEYRAEEESMTDEERQKLNENYGWIKREQEKRQKERELRLTNYERRKAFYLNLFSDYDKSESDFTQTSFEKRLVEEFTEFGQEICDNNQDDNEDGQIDCSDSQCGGKICGKFSEAVVVGNETITTEVNYYCIAGTCQAKEEILVEDIAVCGNHICEENESIETCAEDCSLCQIYEAVNCSGKVIFSGEDENGCPLEPKCIEEEICETDDDCQFLCGKGSCVEGVCELIELTECEDAECEESQEKIINCDSGEKIVSSFCENGLWVKVEGASCPLSETSEEIVTEEIEEEEVIGNECIVASDCGTNDVCSNGKCVRIPEVAESVSEESEETSEEIVTEEIEEEEIGESETSSEETEEAQEIPEEETSSEPESEVEQSSEPEENTNEQSPITGETVLGFIKNAINKITLAITGFDIEENEVETESSDSEEESSGNEEQETESSQESESEETQEDGQEESQEIESKDVEEHEEEYYEDREDDYEEKEREEKERHEEEQKQRCNEECERTCYDTEVRPCVETCIWDSCGNELDCDIDDETSKCEESCKQEKDIGSCIEDCVPKCTSGDGDWWEEYQQEPEEFQMEKGVYNVGGGCRTSQGITEGYLWFGGWGDPFEEIEPLKQKYYSGGESEWCKYDLENLKKQREEFEKGFNQEFVTWFFEDYLANSAEDWEQHVSGIYELYWNNVDNLRETVYRMQCLEIEEFPYQNLISLQYESEYGSIEYWEELKTVKSSELGEEEVTIITPYMKIWIFPSKEFIKYEFEKSMASGEFPGSSEEKTERKNQEGPTEEEKEKIKQNSGFMETIKDVSEKYGGEFDLSVQLKDFENDEIVYNIYAKINEEDILTMQPTLPENVPEEDARIEIDFQEVYDLIYSIEKEMQGEEVESPPWDKKYNKGGFKEITNGIKTSMKVKKILNSAKVYPEEAEKDVKKIIKTFLKMMMQGEKNSEENIEEGSDEEIWSELDESSITGKTVFLHE